MKKWTKGIVASLFATVMMLSTVIPAFAAEPQTPDISPWAVGELNEGEKYGIFPIEWYYDNFRSNEISEERLNEILIQTSEKIAGIAPENYNDFELVSATGTTREDVLNGLFEIVAPLELQEGESAVEYFQDREIIAGTGKGLALEKPATTEQAVIFATRLVKDTYDQLDAGAKGVAWKVENEGNVVYLLGSIHVGTPDLYPFNSKLVDAFNEADSLYVEANLLDTEGLQYFNEVSMFQDGTTIKDVVSEETYAKLVDVLEKYDQPIETYESFKPWSLASLVSNFSMSETFGMPIEQMANSGVDMYFSTNALLTQKPIHELEGIKAQADMFNGLSAEGQEEYLVDTLDSALNTDSLNGEADMISDWFSYWIEGNVDSFAESFNSAATEEPDEFGEMLLGQRDVDMSEKIMGLLESEKTATSFIVVGAGHFITDESILYHLEQNGYEVVPFYE
ncbi:hypothetical protein SAMN04487944_104158 [Gracilibacillus ureilyticus]|uniref:TraB family protein n=1 Tax=Gracilibacillus ureilyticus TaxID=531814 RepID=A0A1H9P9H9_9BACI|nr:TraB/GumN family protein [Gracilibacillus ureilyticus]SER44848.1 hypothetical protein SAMN04487944_104158 [Gracilibacillus ureilyticus]